MGLTERHLFEGEEVPESYEWDLEDAVYNSRTNKKPEDSTLTGNEGMTMPDSEKVIKKLMKLHGTKETIDIIFDAITLLKKQEAVPVVQREVMHMLVWCCGSCGVAITDGDKFCRICGKKVKWE